MTLEGGLFWLCAVGACGSAIAVVLTDQLVRMAFWLVMSLGSVAALFFLLGADVLGATQLLIYVGGTIVLLVFGVMLTASGPLKQIRTSPTELFVASTIGGLLLLVLVLSVIDIDWEIEIAGRLSPTETSIPQVDTSGQTGRSLGLALLGLRPDQVNAQGRALRSGYLLPFEVISVHLVVVLIGAAYLARAKRRAGVARTALNSTSEA